MLSVVFLMAVLGSGVVTSALAETHGESSVAEPAEGASREVEDSGLEEGGLDDARIAVAIKNKWARVGGKSFSSIEVTVKEGVATLSGTAESLWTQQRAKDLSLLIRGVRGVIDRLSVGPVGATHDADIVQHLELLFREDPVVEESDMQVIVKKGSVTLKGRVQSWQEKDTALNLAKMVKGVREVRDALVVQVKEGRPDSVIREEIMRRLEFDVWVDKPDALHVQVRDGNAVIHGEVGNAFEKIRVAELAWIDGVRAVDATGLHVTWDSPDPMERPHRPALTDTAIAAAVEKVLAYDRRVAPFGIQAGVSRGMVTLNGTVPFLSLKREAEQDVRNTVGVRSVENLITVQPGKTLSDEDIRLRVTTAFSRDPVLHTFTLGVSVRTGALLLSGTVDSIYERNHAENVASRVPGVNSLLNQIVFTKPETRKSDWEIQLDIENQVWWSPFLSGQDIVATVTDGKAVLTGSVDHPHQRLIAEQQSFEAGASDVVNRLRVGRASAGTGSPEPPDGNTTPSKPDKERRLSQS